MINIKVNKLQDTTVLNLAGKIDFSNASVFEELLKDNLIDTKKILLDFSEISFIDSTGVGSLISVIKRGSTRGILFEIANVPEGIHEIFEIIGVYEVVDSFIM